MRVFFSLYPCQHLLSLAFVVTVLLTSVRGYFTVVLICISLMTGNAELFSCTCWSIECLLWNKNLFRSFAHFKMWVSGILLLSSLYILYIKPLSDLWFEIFLPVHSWLFTLLTVLQYRNFWVWCSPTFLFLLSLLVLTESQPKIHC